MEYYFLESVMKELDPDCLKAMKRCLKVKDGTLHSWVIFCKNKW